MILTAAFLLLALPSLALGQGKTIALSQTPVSLSQEEFDRLHRRAMGTWRLNREKSTIFSGDTLSVPNGYVYRSTDDGKGVRFTNGTGTSVQQWDGKAYGDDSTISRAPIDEFTIDNVVGRNGHRTGRNTQVYSPDGQRVAYIVRRVDERGQETIVSIVIFERVPEGTPVISPPAKP
jgi:hypothetical protein